MFPLLNSAETEISSTLMGLGVPTVYFLKYSFNCFALSVLMLFIITVLLLKFQDSARNR